MLLLRDIILHPFFILPEFPEATQPASKDKQRLQDQWINTYRWTRCLFQWVMEPTFSLIDTPVQTCTDCLADFQNCFQPNNSKIWMRHLSKRTTYMHHKKIQVACFIYLSYNWQAILNEQIFVKKQLYTAA